MGNKTTNPNVVVARLATTAAEIKSGKSVIVNPVTFFEKNAAVFLL
jgi:hypothetical protein